MKLFDNPSMNTQIRGVKIIWVLIPWTLYHQAEACSHLPSSTMPRPFFPRATALTFLGISILAVLSYNQTQEVVNFFLPMEISQEIQIPMPCPMERGGCLLLSTSSLAYLPALFPKAAFTTFTYIRFLKNIYKKKVNKKK